MADKVIGIDEFKGINQSKDKFNIPIDFAISAQNVDTSNGTLKRCKGMSLYSAAVLATGIKTLLSHFTGSVANILAASNGSIYKLNAGAWASIASGFTSDLFDFINYQKDSDEVTILTNGADNVKVWDGTAFRDLKHDGGASVAGGSNIAPKGKFIERYKERVWMADDENLYFSKDFDIDDWTAPTDEVEANMHGGQISIPTWDGGKVIGLKASFDNIMIYKTHSIHRIFGSYPGNYELLQVFDTVRGHIIDKTIVSIENTQFWATTEGIFAYEGGGNPVNMTPAVKDTFAGVNQAYIDTAVAVGHKNKYIVFLPEGTSQVPNMAIEYDIDTKQYTVKRGFNVSTLLLLDDVLIIADGDGKLYKYDDSDTWDGAAISSTYETGYMFMKNNTVEVEEMYFIGSGSGTVRLHVITDKKDKYIDIPLTTTEKSYYKTISNIGKWLAFKFENLNGCDFEVKQPQYICTVEAD